MTVKDIIATFLPGLVGIALCLAVTAAIVLALWAAS